VPCSDIQKRVRSRPCWTRRRCEYTNAVFYRTVASDLSDIKKLEYDMLVFFSPGGIESLKKNFPKFKQEKVFIAAFGPPRQKQ
jgi:uroporphyrinogen-III synthase